MPVRFTLSSCLFKPLSHYTLFPLRLNGIVKCPRVQQNRRKKLISFMKMKMSWHSHGDKGVATELPLHFIAFLSEFLKVTVCVLLQSLHCTADVLKTFISTSQIKVYIHIFTSCQLHSNNSNDAP